jgi:MSHA biogenesis protein MshK
MAQRLIVLAASSLLAGAAYAQPLADPTRPPTAGSGEVRRSDPAPATRLQSVLISSRHSVAVIDGRAVRLGERVGDATLVAIEPLAVTLERGAARERLTLLPAAVDKKPVRR